MDQASVEEYGCDKPVGPSIGISRREKACTSRETAPEPLVWLLIMESAKTADVLQRTKFRSRVGRVVET